MRKHTLSTLALLIWVGVVGSARAQIKVSGLLSLVARNADTQDKGNRTNFGVSPFDVTIGRFFLDASISDRLSGFVQLYANGYDGAFLYSAYVRYDHTPNWHLEAGLIPTPVGMWGQRTYPDKNPLVSVPAIFQYKTALNTRGHLQTAPVELVAARGDAEYMPIVYDFCWNTGVHGYASVGQFDFGAAVLNGSLGSPQRKIAYDRPNFASHVAWNPRPWMTLGLWGGMGPYLNPDLDPELPSGHSVEDYDQRTVGASARLSWGHWEGHAEGLVNRFEHPFLGDLDNMGGYADVRWEFATRWHAAVRADYLSFSKLDLAGFEGPRWDYPIGRYEFGVARWLSERALLKVVTQIIRYDEAPSGLDDQIYALQFTVKM